MYKIKVVFMGITWMLYPYCWFDFVPCMEGYKAKDR